MFLVDSCASIRSLSNINSRPGINASQSAHTALQRLHQIFAKLKAGIELEASERRFLDQQSAYTPSTTQWLSSWVFTPADQASVQVVDGLAQKIIGEKTNYAEALTEAEAVLTSTINPTDREIAALSRLVQSCASRQMSFLEILDRYSKQVGENLTRGQLIDLIAQFNREALPRQAVAGQTIGFVEIKDPDTEECKQVELRVDGSGKVMIIDGALSPMNEECHQSLTAEQVQEMQDVYRGLIENTYYNNLGEFLEFVRYFQEAKMKNPDLTIKEAFAAYHPDLVGIFDKYQSGTCILLANKFHQKMQERGIMIDHIGRSTLNTWTSLPIPGSEAQPVRWDRFSQAIQGIDHTDATCHFKDQLGQEKIIQFACSFKRGNPDEITECEADKKRSLLDNYMLESRGIDGSQYRPDQVLDPSTIGKMRLVGRFKAVVMKDEKILGVDFLRGNVYINPSWSKTVKGLPLNERGMVSIELSDLAHPDEKGQYTVDGKHVEISHREALRMILSVAKSEMSIPEDMESNIIALAQNHDAFFNELFVNPLPFIREHYQELLVIGKQLNQLQDQINNPEKYGLSQNSEQTIELYRKCRSDYCNLVGQILDEEFDAAYPTMIQLKYDLEQRSAKSA